MYSPLISRLEYEKEYGVRLRGFYPFRTLFCEKTWKMGSVGGKKACFQKFKAGLPWIFCEEIEGRWAKFKANLSNFGSYL